MKRIRTLPGPTPGLTAYLDQGGDPTNWRRFRDYAPEAYLELRGALVALQHGLCGYCEIKLIANDIQIEHIIPRGGPAGCPEHALNYANLIAACRGGIAREFGSDGWNDATRFGDSSCGQAKGDFNAHDFIGPRTLPALPALLQVRPDGIIVADGAASATSAISVERVQRTVEILQLNVERLRLARQNRWNELKEQWDSYRGDPEVMRAAALRELSYGNDYTLPAFFTTARSYFGPLADRILAEQPRTWI